MMTSTHRLKTITPKRKKPVQHVQRKGREKKFSKEEDDLLKKHADEFGDSQWSLIGRKLGRQASTCRARWENVSPFVFE